MKELVKPLKNEEQYTEEVVNAMCDEHTGGCCIITNGSHESDVEDDILF